VAVGLQAPDTLPEIAGITLGVCAAGIRKRDHADVAVVLCEAGTQGAACFTRNRFQAAPVTVAREHLRAQPAPRALVINSGNANAGTGEPGIEDARVVCSALAELIGATGTDVLPFSTGVVGQRLPARKIIDALPAAVKNASPDGWRKAAEAIMTTDTVPKGAFRRFEADGRTVTLTGIVKGSGMICPDMATMLAFLATDAGLPATDRQACLTWAVDRSFNRITVDGDTSTNDACTLLATGRAGDLSAVARESFQNALNELCLELAQSVIRDAEGATKFVEIAVTGAANDEDAKRIAMSIAHSPLVKTALYASDANWGRILAVIGRAPVEELEIGKVSFAINGCSIVRHGAVDPGYRDEQGMAAMAPEEIVIAIDIGLGRGQCSVWTSDLSHEYVRINAEYRT
jgi:glutamate N-acetyltransferase/amino-acid N-acetyltransferase